MTMAPMTDGMMRVGQHMEIWLDRDIRSRDFGVTITIADREGNVAIGKPVVFEHQTETSGQWVQPTFRMSVESAQAMMDALWAKGIRPVEAMGSAGQLAAVQAHLNDMRAIVSSNIGVNLP